MAKESRMAQVGYRATRENTGKAGQAAKQKRLEMIIQMFSGQSLEACFIAAGQWLLDNPQYMVCYALAKQSQDGAFLYIGIRIK